MSKAKYLNELQSYLNVIKREDRNKYMEYYGEMINDYMEEGMSEEEAISKLGHPLDLLDEILEDDTVGLKKVRTNRDIVTKGLLVIGFPLWGMVLLFAIIVIGLGYIVMWLAPTATGAFAVHACLTGIISIVGSFFVMFESVSAGIMQFGEGLQWAGMSILAVFITIWFVKHIVIWSKNFMASIKVLLNKRGVNL